MKNECNIIRDLLPLYAEDMVSEDSKEFVEEHLAKCESCKKELEEIKNTERTQIFEAEKPLKTLKNKLLRKRILTVLLTVLITVALSIITITCLTVPKYFPYSEDLINVVDNGNGTITVTLSEQITDYDCNVVNDSASGKNLYFVEAWTVMLNKLTKNSESRTLEFQIDDENFLLFYTQHNGKEDILVYGEAPSYFGNIVSLPRLYLTYYFITAIALFIFLLILSCILEKKFGNTKLVKAISFITMLPCSYAIAHICSVIAGWSMYSHGIYFISNLSLTVVIYFIQMLIIKLIEIKKETKQINQ